MAVISEGLEEIFRQHAGKPFVLVKPGGNWGDDLIYWGARALADRLSIRWHEIEVGDFLARSIDPTAVVYIHGGGGFNPFSSGRVVKALHHAISHHSGIVIQGPQTFATEPDQLRPMISGIFDKRSAETVIVFSREEASLKAIQTTFPGDILVGQNEDTAFFITRDDVERRIGKTRQRYELRAVRQDTEGNGLEPPTLTKAVTVDPAYFATSFDHWLRLHAAATKIVTDRTHSSILGAILGIPTTLYAGRYHKNHSIWNFSLQRRGVLWLENESLLPTPTIDGLQRGGIFGRLDNSWKVQRFGKWLQGVPLS